MPNDEKQFFDQESKQWDDKPGRLEFAQKIATAITQEVHLRSDMAVLEFGCGTGIVSRQIYSSVASILGIDSSEGMISQFNTQIEKLGAKNIIAKVADILNQGSIEGQFNLIFASLTMHHIPNAATVIKRLAELLKPKGYLIIFDLDEDPENLFHQHLPNVAHQGLSRNTVKDWFKDAGLNELKDRNVTSISKEVKDLGEKSFQIFMVSGKLSS